MRSVLEGVAVAFVGRFGMVGVFVGTFVADAFACPVPPWFYFVLTVGARAPTVRSFLVVCLASLLGAHTAYALSDQAVRIPLLRPRIEAMRARLDPLVARYGYRGVFFVGLLPLPFAFTCYAAGCCRLPQMHYRFYLLMRIARLLVFFALVRIGMLGA